VLGNFVGPEETIRQMGPKEFDEKMNQYAQNSSSKRKLGRVNLEMYLKKKGYTEPELTEVIIVNHLNHQLISEEQGKRLPN
jgi:hypothetical protein